MTQYILWSGGCDSTLLLKNNATDNPNDTINAVTVLGVSNGTEQEKAEKKTWEILKKKLPNNIKYRTIEVKTDLQGMTWQMPFWICYLAPLLNNNDIVKIGYLDSDGLDFWAHKDKLSKAFEALMDLQGKSNTKLEFPFSDKTKGYVITELKTLKLLKYTWWCGVPKNNRPCGKCMKCYDMKRWSKYPESGVLT